LATKESEARSAAAKTKAEANFKKEERAAEGAKAMLEYQASGREIREQMAKLRALRLAKEAEDKIRAVAEKSIAKAASKTTSKSPKAAKPKKVAAKAVTKAPAKAVAAVE
jgi:hypothetical protein